MAKARALSAGDMVTVNGSVDGTFTGSSPARVINPHSNADRVTSSVRGREYEGMHRHIRTVTVEIDRSRRKLSPLRFEAFSYQVARLRDNPSLVTFANPRKAVAVLSERAYALQYRHIEDGNDYSHKFKAGVSVELLSDGSVRLFRKDGQSLWGDF